MFTLSNDTQLIGVWAGPTVVPAPTTR